MDIISGSTIGSFLYPIVKDAVLWTINKAANRRKGLTLDVITQLTENPTESEAWAEGADSLAFLLDTEEGQHLLRQLPTNRRVITIAREMFTAKLVGMSLNHEEVLRESLRATIGGIVGDKLNSNRCPDISDAVYETFENAFERAVLEIQQQSPTSYAILQKEWRETAILSVMEHLPERAARLTDLKKQEKLDQMIHEWIPKYIKACRTKYKNIQTPDFSVNHRIEIDRLYVPPRFKRYQGVERLHHEIPAEWMLENIHRTVIMGDPGAGKTTFSQYLINQEIKKNRRIPFIVVLREYAHKDLENERSITEFMAEQLSSRYGTALSINALESILSDGNACVIFDGLDELIDSNHRREVRDRVEIFSVSYPHADILVTSRRIGYEEAPLDPQVFDAFIVGSFDTKSTHQYVKQWFETQSSDYDNEPGILAADFMAQSHEVSDLRSNPLMLSLMCMIYRGEHYIPQNRPEVLEKCAKMLFEKWDGHRSIVVPLAVKKYVDSALQFLAYSMYLESGHDTIMGRQDIVRNLQTYLEDRSFEHSEEREKAAEEFVDFCSGRAWVLCEAGEEKGQKLLKFTHRTFLEYFAAYHICKKYLDPGKLANFLLPHISVAEWDMVAQLAVQIKDKGVDMGSQLTLEKMVRDKRDRKYQKRENVLTFVSRCLKFATVSDSFIKEFCGLVVERSVLEVSRQSAFFNANIDALKSLVENSTLHGTPIVRYTIEALAVSVRSPDSKVSASSIRLMLLLGALGEISAPSIFEYINDATCRLWSDSARKNIRENSYVYKNFVKNNPEVSLVAVSAGALTEMESVETLRDPDRLLSFFTLRDFEAQGAFSNPFHLSGYGLLACDSAMRFPRLYGDYYIFEEGPAEALLGLVKDTILAGGFKLQPISKREKERAQLDLEFALDLVYRATVGNDSMNRINYSKSASALIAVVLLINVEYSRKILPSEVYEFKEVRWGSSRSEAQSILANSDFMLLVNNTHPYWKSVIKAWLRGQHSFIS
ncbi:NACHT domain-containing NTPase [Kocuria sabuli]|uniref:NACHT domain-containing protein n=1 Tax=Kocuria sabuli TaxID=3071448 RepID=UPI0034D534FF